MFGYIMPDKPELKIKEFEAFKAFYCGVCKAIKKRSGQIPRFTLNYDTTFLAILLSSISNEKIDIKKEHCIIHPIRKIKYVINHPIVDYAADMNVILAYLSLTDKWKDEKSFAALMGIKVLKSRYKNLKSKYDEKCGTIEEGLKKLTKLEVSKCNSMDEAAEPFAKLMEEIAVYRPLIHSAREEEVHRWLGYNIGKWVYIIDAFDDIEKDIKKRNYNPLIYQFKYHGQDINVFKNKVRERVSISLFYTLEQIERAYRLLDVKRHKSILDNIIHIGMFKTTERILKVGECKNGEQSLSGIETSKRSI
ncbi:MAG: DUF5685 family protein [Clostridia bacterium]|nr:DUF5685 family protein [Clostridia bacterium]